MVGRPCLEAELRFLDGLIRLLELLHPLVEERLNLVLDIHTERGLGFVARGVRSHDGDREEDRGNSQCIANTHCRLVIEVAREPAAAPFLLERNKSALYYYYLLRRKKAKTPCG